MGRNVVCFTIVWQDRDGQKHCLLAKHDSDPAEEIVKWIECKGFGRDFVSHLYYAVADVTPWLSGVCRNRKQETEFLQPYFGQHENEWLNCNVVYCTFQQFLQFRESTDAQAQFAAPSQDEARELNAALVELNLAARFRNMLWYWPFGWRAREQRFDAAQTVVQVLQTKETARKERKMSEYRSKMLVLEENVVEEVKEALGKRFQDGLEAENVGILFICY